MSKQRLEVVSCSRSQARDQGRAVYTGTLPLLVPVTYYLWLPWRSVALGVLVSPRSGYSESLGLWGCFLSLAYCSWPISLENFHGTIKSQLSRSLCEAFLIAGDRSLTMGVLPQHVDILDTNSK